MKNLREKIRRSKFQTQERFAEATGINEALISKYCRGLRQPSKKHIEIIKEFLLRRNNGTSESWLSSNPVMTKDSINLK